MEVLRVSSAGIEGCCESGSFLQLSESEASRLDLGLEFAPPCFTVVAQPSTTRSSNSFLQRYIFLLFLSNDFIQINRHLFFSHLLDLLCSHFLGLLDI